MNCNNQSNQFEKFRPLKKIEKNTEIAFLYFNDKQAKVIESGTYEIATAGGPQIKGAQNKVFSWANKIIRMLDTQQIGIIKSFEKGYLSALIFQNMIDCIEDNLPIQLPKLNQLKKDFNCLRLASRNQILLQLVKHKTFAYDIDNNGEIIRLIGNFKGGGQTKIHENIIENPELSSHSGLALGPHTEAPYYFSIKSLNGYSPAPSALILTARWNPKNELTSIIPMHPVIKKLGAQAALALTSKSFQYSRSDSFTAGLGENGKNVSILDFDDNGSFVIRYNTYRFSVNENAHPIVKSAFQKLSIEVNQAQIFKFSLQPSSTIVINNCRALHCREIIKDNRRMLIRLFGYSQYAKPNILSRDPLIVKG